jgi:hypothetical protein
MEISFNHNWNVKGRVGKLDCKAFSTRSKRGEATIKSIHTRDKLTDAIAYLYIYYLFCVKPCIKVSNCIDTGLNAKNTLFYFMVLVYDVPNTNQTNLF